MSRKKNSTALAVAEIPNLPAPGSTITTAQAVQIAQQVGAKLFRDAKEEQRAKRRDLAAGVGGQISRIDETVLDQARRLMARLALISQHKKSGNGSPYGGGSSSSPIDGLVKKMGAIVGEIEALMLTDKSVGLFEQVSEDDFRQRWGHDEDDPLSYVGKNARDEAERVLAQFTIVDADAKPKKNGRREKRVSPARAIAEQDAGEAGLEDEGDDEENGDL